MKLSKIRYTYFGKTLKIQFSSVVYLVVLLKDDGTVMIFVVVENML